MNLGSSRNEHSAGYASTESPDAKQERVLQPSIGLESVPENQEFRPIRVDRVMHRTVVEFQ